MFNQKRFLAGRARREFLKLFCLGLKFYKSGISFRLGPSCRFYPSCSSYFSQALNKYGIFLGSLKGCWRLLRCNPFSAGGYDPAGGEA